MCDGLSDLQQNRFDPSDAWLGNLWQEEGFNSAGGTQAEKEINDRKHTDTRLLSEYRHSILLI